jgi:Ca-activated chloride channel homolog
MHPRTVLLAALAMGSSACTQPDDGESLRESSSPSVEFVRLRRAAPPDVGSYELSTLRARIASPGAESEWNTAAAPPAFDRERYDALAENPFLSPLDEPRSTFSIDVDTASYSNVRRLLSEGVLPPRGAVRIEEMINYFDYSDPMPVGDRPFTVSTELSQAPWRTEHLLLRVSLQAAEIPDADVPPRNLVFLLDVSGSMESPDKLPLVKRALRGLTERMRAEDRVAIVVYAGASGLALPPTSGRDAGTILAALDRLEAGGSTNGGEGIALAYAMARQSFDPEAINRVILATDGDFNVGITSRSDLMDRIEREREGGVFLTVLGVGTGNLDDAGLEELADHGNGNYAYLDSVAEARKVLVAEAGSTLVTVAKDVKIQIEFNPKHVGAYRLIGYENRLLADRDFDDDAVDAGEIGAGHCVTALYEIVPAGMEAEAEIGRTAPLRYRDAPMPGASSGSDGGELAFVRLRYKEPLGERSELLEHPVPALPTSLGDASEDLRFGSAVALFGMLLRDSDHAGSADYDLVRELAAGAVGADPRGQRGEFLHLAALASELPETETPSER